CLLLITFSFGSTGIDLYFQFEDNSENPSSRNLIHRCIFVFPAQ
ncbi:hypothetical protein TNCT_715841, partial [Trichonephila clavata]